YCRRTVKIIPKYAPTQFSIDNVLSQIKEKKIIALKPFVDRIGVERFQIFRYDDNVPQEINRLRVRHLRFEKGIVDLSRDPKVKMVEYGKKRVVSEAKYNELLPKPSHIICFTMKVIKILLLWLLNISAFTCELTNLKQTSRMRFRDESDANLQCYSKWTFRHGFEANSSNSIWTSVSQHLFAKESGIV
ncbi:hypothetical protein GIB67_021186, partial [Kingdonia uniflora]